MSYTLVIEASSYCNQQCFFCPQYKYRERNKIMPMKLFKSIIDSLYDMRIGIKLIVFSGMGEPLTDDSLFEKIKYASKICTNVIIYTNGALFTEEKLRLVNELVSRVYFSIHMNTPEEYEKYSGNKFEKTKEIALMAKRILGPKLVILNYPSGALSQKLGLPTGPTHPIHNWGDEEIAKKTGSKMLGCKFRYDLNDLPIKFKVDGSISTCGNDWNNRNNLLTKDFPACKNCCNYNYFMELIKDKRFDSFVQLLNKFHEEVLRRNDLQ